MVADVSTLKLGEKLVMEEMNRQMILFRGVRD
jgi:hypothetical protein